MSAGLWKMRPEGGAEIRSRKWPMHTWCESGTELISDDADILLGRAMLNSLSLYVPRALLAKEIVVLIVGCG
jgi:hypothetical protein